MRIHVCVIDPQNDFCDPNGGTLVVPGAMDDMARLAAMIDRLGDKIDDISVTLDSHQSIGIERPDWWKRVGDGAKPSPFTILGIHSDGRRVVKFNADANGLHQTEEEYTTRLPGYMHKGGPTGKGSFGYLEVLAANKRYPHVIWPIHCRVGSWGHAVVPVLDAAVSRWEIGQFGKANFVTKGNNPYTEHFSAVKAEVPDPSDASTQVNTRFIQTLEEADLIALSGEALSHCVYSTTQDVADCFSDPKYVEKLVLLKDATSNVTGFNHYGDKFIADLTKRGMKISTTTEFLA